MKAELSRQLRGEEGVRPCVYKDHLGFWTIGIGRLVDERKADSGLRPDEMTYLLNNDIDDRINALNKRLYWFGALDGARQGVLLNMAFQMGVEGLLGFENTLAMIENGEYDKAAVAMLKSKWARQTPARAQRMAEQMRTGFWQYAEGT